MSVLSKKETSTGEKEIGHSISIQYELRADISKISQMNTPRPSPKILKNANFTKTNYQIVDEQTRSNSLETLK